MKVSCQTLGPQPQPGEVGHCPPRRPSTLSQDLLSGRPELTPSPSPSQRVKSTAAPPTASPSGTQVDSADRQLHPACRL